MLLHGPDRADHQQLGDQMRGVEPERFRRVVDGHLAVGCDHEKIGEHHAEQGAQQSG